MLRDPDGRFRPRWADDSFDPRGWALDMPWRLVWLDDKSARYALIDHEDYDLVANHLWSATANSTGEKFYATRVQTQRKLAPPKVKLYLHKLIMARIERPPSDLHIIADHKNGDSLDNRRTNLRWATPSMNRRNSRGSFYRQFQLGLA